MDKYENEYGQIGVIISRGFGAGWSTWNDDGEFFSMDKTLVEMKLNDASEEEVEAYCRKVRDDTPYMGGWSDACVEWIDKGTSFTIEEYDGSESLCLIADLTMIS